MVGYTILRILLPYAVQICILCNIECIARSILHDFIIRFSFVGIPAQEREMLGHHIVLIQYSYGRALFIRALRIYRSCAARKRDIRMIGHLYLRLPYGKQVGVPLNIKCISGLKLDGSGFRFILI